MSAVTRHSDQSARTRCDAPSLICERAVVTARVRPGRMHRGMARGLGARARPCLVPGPATRLTRAITADSLVARPEGAEGAPKRGFGVPPAPTQLSPTPAELMIHMTGSAAASAAALPVRQGSSLSSAGKPGGAARFASSCARHIALLPRFASSFALSCALIRLAMRGRRCAIRVRPALTAYCGPGRSPQPASPTTPRGRGPRSSLRILHGLCKSPGGSVAGGNFTGPCWGLSRLSCRHKAAAESFLLIGTHEVDLVGFWLLKHLRIGFAPK